MVCSSSFRVTSLCARWPGSCHDSRIWRNSHLCQQFKNGIHVLLKSLINLLSCSLFLSLSLYIYLYTLYISFFINQGLHDGILLGESGHPLTRHLMTPYLTLSKRSEEKFNASIYQTRVLI